MKSSDKKLSFWFSFGTFGCASYLLVNWFQCVKYQKQYICGRQMKDDITAHLYSVSRIINDSKIVILPLYYKFKRPSMWFGRTIRIRSNTWLLWNTIQYQSRKQISLVVESTTNCQLSRLGMAASFANIIRKHNLAAEEEHENNIDDKIERGNSDALWWSLNVISQNVVSARPSELQNIKSSKIS